MIALWITLKSFVAANAVGILGFGGYALLEWVLPRTKLFAANSAIELLANLGKKALLDRVPLVGKIVAALATPMDKEEPKLRLPPGSSARALLPLAFLALASIAGCATTKTLFADEAAKCGAKAAAALAQTEGVLMTATDAASAMADIGTIIGAAATDASAVYCIVEVAVADLRSKRAADGGTAPADTQMRALVTGDYAYRVAGAYAYPTDPVAHGIAVGQDILAKRAQ